MKTGYVLSNDWFRERERLNAVEWLWDAFTLESLRLTGVTEGWHCLEVGAGAGTIAACLGVRVGPAGRVVATDINTALLQGIDIPNIEVIQHDIVEGPKLEGSFDLVHARLLLEHLPNRAQALQNMIDLLRPGGWLVVEDTDWGSLSSVTSQKLFKPILEVIVEVLEQAGHDAYYGRKLKRELMSRGLVNTLARTDVKYLEASSPGMAILRLTLAQLKPKLVAENILSAETLDELASIMDSPDFAAISYTMFSVLGRKAGKRPDR